MHTVHIKFTYAEVLKPDHTDSPKEIIVIGCEATPENVAKVKELLGEQLEIHYG